MEGNISLKISGDAIYKAVKNYILHSPEIQKSITEEVDKLILSGTIKGVAERAVKDALSGYRLEQIVKDGARDAVTGQIRTLIEEHVRKFLSNSVIIAPKG